MSGYFFMLNVETIEKLKTAVLVKRPILKEIMEKRGQRNIIDYAVDYLDVNLNQINKNRQTEVITVFEKVVKNNLGEAVAKKAAEQLAKYYFVSTADHHGPLCHPFFLNSHLVTSAVCLKQPITNMDYVIALSCANVSFSNSSFPRGLLFHSSKNENLQLQQLGFFPNSSSVRQARIFNYPAYSQSDIERLKKRINELFNTGEITDNINEQLFEIVEQIYADPDTLSCQYYADQITKTNYALWNRMFAKMKINGPKILYIELEAIVANLLIDFHLDQDTLINRLIFLPDYRELFIKKFDEIEGGYSLKKGWGTYLFWALPKEEKYCQQLRYKDGYLVSTTSDFRIALQPEAIADALKNKIILPSTQLSLLILSLYYGVKCLGGFCQVNYLTIMREAYRNLLQEKNENDSLIACEHVQTKELGEDLTVAFLANSKEQRDLATSLDIILYGNDKSWPNLQDEIESMGFEQALMPMMPEFYRIMYPETERDQNLAQITANDIIKINGLDKKIKPCCWV